MKIKTKSRLAFVRNIIIFLGLIYLTFKLLFKDQDMNQLLNVIRSSNKIWIGVGIACMMAYYFMEAYNVRSILKSFGEKLSMLSAIKFTWIGFFFSAITPAASGGQPVEIYYMTKEKISGPNATLALLIQTCGYQISTLTYGIICGILNFQIIGGFIWLFIIGLAINGFALAIMLIAIFSKRLTKKLVDILIKIMRALRIKNIEEKKIIIEGAVKDYNESSVYIKSHMDEFTKAICRTFIQMAFYYLIPFCVYKSFGLGDHNIAQIFAMQAILFTTVSALPLPGSIGVSETIFLSLFGAIFGSELLSGSMLLSRGITFYLFVVLSLIVVIINGIKMKNVNGEMDEKVMELENEIISKGGTL